MDTNDLIRTLAADNDTHERSVGHLLLAALVLAVPVSTALFLTNLGVRPDVMTAMRNPMFDLKFVVTMALAVVAIVVSLHLSRPEASLGRWAWLLAIPVGLLGIGMIGEMTMMPHRAPMSVRMIGSNSKLCVVAIPLLSLPLLAAALFALRRVVAAGCDRCVRRAAVGRTRSNALRRTLHRRFADVCRDVVLDCGCDCCCDRGLCRIACPEILIFAWQFRLRTSGGLALCRVLPHPVEAQNLLGRRRAQHVVTRFVIVDIFCFGLRRISSQLQNELER